MNRGPFSGPAQSTPGAAPGQGVVVGRIRWESVGPALIVAAGSTAMLGGAVLAVIALASWK